MKNKIIVFFVILTICLVPATAGATNLDPAINLTIIVNTQVVDNSFYIDTSYNTSYSPAQTWIGGGQFYIDTTNLSGSKIIRFSSNEFRQIIQYQIVGLKLNNISCISDNPNQEFIYESDYYGRLYGVVVNPTGIDGNITCTFSNVKYQPKTPVLIVPGLMGTEIKNANETLWLDLGRMAADIGDSFLDQLRFNTDLTATGANLTTGNIIGSPLVTQHFYDLLIKEFKNQGYTENQDLFTFPYDWRYGVTGKYADGTTNADLLAKKIKDIMAQTGASKVDVVAHSLGGLITKQYVINHPTDNHVGKAVFVGVPNTGAPKAVKGLLQGDNFGIPWLSDSEMKKVAANMPAAYDLLPDQQYYDVKGSYIKVIDQTKCLNNDATPCDVKDLNYQESNSFLNSQGYNSLAINNALNLHTQSFDNFDLRTVGVDLYAIDGCKSATIGKIAERKYIDIFGKSQTDFDMPFYTLGDNTVPLESSTNLPIDSAKKYYALAANHGKMPSQEGIRQEIVNLISGSNLSTGSNLITQDINWCQLNGRAISVFSPVNIFVIDQNGNKLGLAEDGSIVNEIPNADFEIIGEHKFLYLPQDNGQIYAINMQGTATGTYTIKSQNISNGQITKAEIFSDLPVTPTLIGQVDINSNGTTVLSVKQNLNDAPITILPSKVLDFLLDKTAPEVTMWFDLSVKDLKFIGTDNLSDSSLIPIADNNNVVNLKDEAGNTMELNFKERNRRSAMSAEMIGIKYNSVPVTMGSNLFSYSWSLDRAGNLVKLTQKIKARNNYSLTAIYDGVTTKITGTTSTGKISQSFSGLKIIKVSTSNGNLNWSY